ncbi:hypothetical protein C7T94_04625 [Pedobacter yulinensis]|uniref:DinB-like domain-containing protein n=1 Tax=Pedobacter yulinensis TaxID=2126353 RepID=A0A2T3HNM0_9SPHI|nr:DinB family protein [Pedobacter yulinensis]PST84026.1 hypothetical protein C7T94_04625 [Pedobacter yulinensis]
MRTDKICRQLGALLETYQQVLQHLPAEEFSRRPFSGGWSRSEVFWHILDATHLSLQTARDCAEGHGKVRRTPLATRIILFFGSLPPGRYKMPAMLASRSRSCSAHEAQKLLDRVLSELKRLCPELKKADPAVKTRHPRLGYLNAGQWLRFAWIHLKHHEKQLQRISRSLSAKAT